MSDKRARPVVGDLWTVDDELADKAEWLAKYRGQTLPVIGCTTYGFTVKVEPQVCKCCGKSDGTKELFIDYEDVGFDPVSYEEWTRQERYDHLMEFDKDDLVNMVLDAEDAKATAPSNLICPHCGDHKDLAFDGVRWYCVGCDGQFDGQDTYVDATAKEKE